MKILLTGGHGFLGGRLAQALSARGDDIALGSRRARPAPAWLPAARAVTMDWDSPDSLAGACRGIDAVIHLAGMNAQDSAADPAAARRFNGEATARLAAAAARGGAKRFVHLSTAHVYGALTGTITERTPAAGTHPYATSHLEGEEAVHAAARRGDIDGLVVRLSNAFGAPADPAADCWMLLMNDLCRQAVTAGAMVLRSSGLQRRDFIPVSEACRAIDHLLRLGPGHAGVFNLGGSWSPTVWEAAQLVQERCEAVTGARPTLTRPDPAPGESSPSLEFRSDALEASGFARRDDRIPELDRLIAACRQWFGQESRS